MADFFKRGHILNERGISRCLKIYDQSFQIVSFKTVCANLHQMHVAAADDGNCCCSMIIIDCNYLAKFCCFPILLSICFHHFIPLSNYLMFQSLIGELVEFSTSKPVTL